MGFFDGFKKKEVELPPPPLPVGLSENFSKNYSNNNINNNTNNTNLNSLESKIDISKDINSKKEIDAFSNEQTSLFSNINIEKNNMNNDFNKNLTENIDNKDKNNIINNNFIENNKINNMTTQNFDKDIKNNERDTKEDFNKNKLIPNELPSLPFQEKKIDKQINQNFENIEVFKNISDSNDKIEFEIPVFSDANEEEILKNINSKIDLNVFDFEEPDSNIMYNIGNTKKFDKKPLFIRTDHYSSILATIDSVKEYTTNSPTIIYNLENLKKNQDIEHKKLKNCIEDIQRKIIYVDKVLFEKEVF
ncbi:MAG: hypothetical protein QXR96_01170 [Candidatus Woesearchaeota archaeon]